MKSKGPASISGADRFCAIHLDAFWPKLRIIKKRFFTVRSIWILSMKLAATGRSSVTAALTAMPQSPIASSIDLAMTELQVETPAALGYRMPAEWEPHDATWIAWPHNAQDWPGKFQAIPWIYAEIVRQLARVENVKILVDDEADEVKARQVLVRSMVIPERASDP